MHYNSQRHIVINLIILFTVCTADKDAGINPVIKSNYTKTTPVIWTREPEEWELRKWRNLKWGFSSSAYQIEGGWNEDGKGPSIWDNFTHRVPSPIKDGSNGDVSCDSYHLYQADVEILDLLGVQAYRLSLSWSRILPNGRKESLNPAGVRYYNALLDALKAKNIEPIVTLHHFDLPQALEDLGGFLNATLIVNSFRDYAHIAFSTFGDRVKNWITFNEPWVTCVHGYETGLFAPGKVVEDPKIGSLLCGHNLLKAHAVAYRLYERRFKAKQGGKIGISLFAPWFDGFSELEEVDWIRHTFNRFDEINAINERGAELARQEVIGWFAQPLINGTYPDELSIIYGRENIHNFSSSWKKMINKSVDFLGVNHYTTFGIENGKWHSDKNKTRYYSNPASPQAASSWLRSEPWGFRKLLRWLQKEYSNITIYITENGFSTDESEYETRDSSYDVIADFDRMFYFHDYINQLKASIIEDHVDVQVYTAWSLYDNFEWVAGYSEKFGVYMPFHRLGSGEPRSGVYKASACMLNWKFNYERQNETNPLLGYQELCLNDLYNPIEPELALPNFTSPLWYHDFWTWTLIVLIYIGVGVIFMSCWVIYDDILIP